MKKIALSFVLVCAMLLAAVICVSAATVDAKYIVFGTNIESQGAKAANWFRVEEFNVNAAKEYTIGDKTVAKGEDVATALFNAGKITITDNLGSHNTDTYNNKDSLVDGRDRGSAADWVFAQHTFMKKMAPETLTAESPFVDQGITAYIQYEFDQAYSLESYDILFQGIDFNLSGWTVLASTDGTNWSVVSKKADNLEKDLFAIEFDAAAAPAPATTTAAPATTTAAPATTTAAPAATTKAPAAATTVTAAQTSDIALVMALGLVVVAGLAYTASKKSR